MGNTVIDLPPVLRMTLFFSRFRRSISECELAKGCVEAGCCIQRGTFSCTMWKSSGARPGGMEERKNGFPACYFLLPLQSRGYLFMHVLIGKFWFASLRHVSNAIEPERLTRAH